MRAKADAKPVLKDLPLATVYQLIEPGPVVLLTTAQGGRANVMTMSWHMMVEFELPLNACIVSASNHSFEALRKTKQCVIAIPALNPAPVVVKIGNCSGRDVDKFTALGLATCTAEHVSPPLIVDCFANLERHAANRAGAWLRLSNFWMHRASEDAGGLRRDFLQAAFPLLQVSCRIRRKFRLALGRAEEIGLSRELVAVLSF